MSCFDDALHAEYRAKLEAHLVSILTLLPAGPDWRQMLVLFADAAYGDGRVHGVREANEIAQQMFSQPRQP